MNEGVFLQENYPWLLAVWVFVSIWGFQVALYRAFVDRIRSGASGSSEGDLRKNKLVARLLDSPFELRPWSVEGATLSAAQFTAGMLAFYGLGLTIFSPETEWVIGLVVAASLFLALFSERTLSGILGPMVAARPFASSCMQVARPAMYIILKLCSPLRALLGLKKRCLQTLIGKEEEAGEAVEEVVEHIRTLQEEGSELDPEIREIVGNTLDLRNLDVQHALLPRNQVVFLDANDSSEDNLDLVRSSGHTRLPLCDGDLDRCLGIVHVKDVFGRLAKGKDVDLRKLARPAPVFLPTDPLPVALQRLLQLRAHMAMVRDEFGGTDGVITLEDVLEEVVGEIRDEFDMEEDFIISQEDGSWRVSGMAPVHELPSEFSLGDEEEDAATFGGALTAELGRIPEPREQVTLGNLEVTIEEADETRVVATTVHLKEPKEDNGKDS
ncbi:MAG: hemolysin family protein [Opitutales bacterium]